MGTSSSDYNDERAKEFAEKASEQAKHKKEYKAGEIATLTISATDINGAKVYGAATLGAGVAISGGQLTDGDLDDFVKRVVASGVTYVSASFLKNIFSKISERIG